MLYTPTFLNPRNNTIDPSVNNTFSCQINGTKCVAYEIFIMKNSDNSQVYTSTKVDLAETLYDKDILEHEVPADTLLIATATEYKWKIKTYYNTTDYSESGEAFFTAFGTPTIEFDNFIPIVTTQSYEFIINYTHPQDVAIRKFKFILYDNNNEILEETEWRFSGNIRHTFEGFINESQYGVKCIVEDQNGITVETDIQTFTIEYGELTVPSFPTVKQKEELSAVEIEWYAKQIIGQVEGGSHIYLNNFMVEGNNALELGEDAILNFNFDIPKDFSLTFYIKLDTDFQGVFCKLNDSYYIGYENDRFYFHNNGVNIYGIPRSIPAYPFYVVVNPTEVIIKKIFDDDTGEVLKNLIDHGENYSNWATSGNNYKLAPLEAKVLSYSFSEGFFFFNEIIVEEDFSHVLNKFVYINGQTGYITNVSFNSSENRTIVLVSDNIDFGLQQGDKIQFSHDSEGQDLIKEAIQIDGKGTYTDKNGITIMKSEDPLESAFIHTSNISNLYNHEEYTFIYDVLEKTLSENFGIPFHGSIVHNGLFMPTNYGLNKILFSVHIGGGFSQNLIFRLGSLNNLGEYIRLKNIILLKGNHLDYIEILKT